MKIAFITTVDHNVGDDFVREGLTYLLRQHFKGQNISFSSVHKHAPISTRMGFEKVKDLSFSEKWDNRLPLWITPDKIMSADLVVQSGAPVYWYHRNLTNSVTHNEWYGPLIKRRFLKNKSAMLFNIAAGSCQTFFSDGSEFQESKEVCDYIREFYELSSVTTLRDSLSGKVFGQLGLDAPVIPCSSIFAIDEYGLRPETPEYVVVNYMAGGAHYTFNQPIDFDKWKKEFTDFYYDLKKTEKVIFSCHDEKEVAEAKQIDPDAQIFYSKSFLEFMKFYAKAKYGVMNRVHGGFLIASYGRPSIVIGNDSRARMASEIGVRNYFVNDASRDMLNREVELLRKETSSYPDKFARIKQAAYSDYMTAFGKARGRLSKPA